MRGKSNEKIKVKGRQRREGDSTERRERIKDGWRAGDEDFSILLQLSEDS